jgi:uncharacterized protein DUF3606
MPDDPTKRRPLDANRINIHEPYEVRWWTHELGCTEQQLRDAVRQVGTSAQAVRNYLKGT